MSYKNPSPALPILPADFTTKLFSSIADFGRITIMQKNYSPQFSFIIYSYCQKLNTDLKLYVI
ncbi:MAG TPA: hypothetical protein HPP56_03800 [Nitrospirae bacterium]|nr:hypothetical protein [Nitrospirota bacterium]